MTEPVYAPTAGDLVWIDLDPRVGRVQSGRRPALVVSPGAFWHATRFAIVCPITTRVRPFPTSAILPDGLPVGGEILISHVRSIDTLARSLTFAGAAVPAPLLAEVRVVGWLLAFSMSLDDLVITAFVSGLGRLLDL